MRDIPKGVTRAAADVRQKWAARIAQASPVTNDPTGGMPRSTMGRMDPDAGKTPHQRMIDKIKRRMREYPEWYDTDADRIAETVCSTLDTIFATLTRMLPSGAQMIEVWEIPLSVFNWLIEDDQGERFYRGALSAWASAEQFGAANSPALTDDERDRLRKPFLDISPPVLRAVLLQIMDAGLKVSFTQKYIGPDFKYLVMRLHRPEFDAI